MDFVSNMWSKSGLKGKDAEEPQEAQQQEGQESIESEPKDKDQDKKEATGTVGFVSNMFKSTFNSDRKSSVSGEAAAEKKEEPSAGGFVSNIWKSTFKSGGETGTENKDRKASAAASEAGVSGEGGDEEPKDDEGLTGEGNEAVSQKAIDSAKTFGSFLYSVANKAGQTVSATAKQLKHSVESTSLLADFTNEQQEFVKEHGGNIQVGDPPWVGCEREDEVKTQIISLSQDKRNFVRSPPAGVQFDFEMQSMLPIALALLKEDENLGKMRFEIVPKLVNEETFWRNYFYRVSLLKQSTQLSSINKGNKGWASSSSSSAEGPDDMSPTHADAEFVSESFQDDPKGKRQMKKKQDSKVDEKHWEDEITKELQEFEVVGGVNNSEEAELEQDLAAL